MLKRFFEKFRTSEDKTEKTLKSLFDFLLNDYGFHFAKGDLGNAVDKSGKFFFYGPLNAYYIYNKNVCINVLYLVQRQDYYIYITDTHKEDQIYIKNGIAVSDDLAYDLKRFADEVKHGVVNCGEIYGRKI